MMSESVAILAGACLALMAPVNHGGNGDEGVRLRCVADGCQARLEAKGPTVPAQCDAVDFDLNWIPVNGSCKCPEVCVPDKATCVSAFAMYIFATPIGSGVGISVNGDCGFEENWAFSSSGVAGCGGQGAWQQIVVTQGLCGGPELCDFSFRAFCRSCSLDC